MSRSSKIAVVTVHGTGDTASDLTGEKWFQQGAPFAQRLQQHLTAQGLEADIIPHLWSGANSAWDRERAANKLAARVRKLFDKYDSIHLIGHSHGGNVANDAAVLLKWGLRRSAKNERLDSLITVGTPFFNVRTGWLQKVAGILFQILAWGSAIVFPVTALIWLAAEAQRGFAGADGILPLLYILVVAPCVWLMLRMSSQGVRRVLRPRLNGKTTTSVFAIWHENDEAISFLRRVEELPLEAFPRGSVVRSSRATAISLGVLAVILFSVAVPILFVLGFDVINIRQLAASPIDPTAYQETDAGEFAALIVVILILGLWVAPPLFTGIYLAFRYLFGGAGELLGRGSVNRFATSILRGVAMGRDGDQVLCNVGPRSHTHPTIEHVLSGECAARMQQGANAAAGALIEKYRWALFSVAGDSSASLTALTTDAMTWNSLIHTTYFDQPEVAQVIGDYIVQRAHTVEQPAPASA
ncbi:MAG: hypothetical protein KF700_04720 [Hyphomonadaceae bacterium]|nr:hypothetical protein [Hyphomonadaceae bacterium]